MALNISDPFADVYYNMYTGYEDNEDTEDYIINKKHVINIIFDV